RLPWWQGLMASLWPEGDWSPAMQEWRHLEWARQQGLLVPESIAAGEFVGPYGRLRSFLAVEELPGMLPLHEAVPAAAATLIPANFARWKAGLAQEIARLTCILHRQRYYHKDLYLCHFYIKHQDVAVLPVWPGRIHMIDFHRLAHH